MKSITPLQFVVPLLLLSSTEAELETTGDKMFRYYLAQETAKIADQCLADIDTWADWQKHKDLYRTQLYEMLGLDPLPEKTPLQPTITGIIEQDDFEVWNLHYQSMPGLYVTANLYRPKILSQPVPAILYGCGHSRVKKDGISYGNKVSYQHHGAWFARNGYVCLVIDTLQLGEIEGIHHGTYNQKMWWWNSRGYTSAGVEAWNCIRALDYLETLDFVDSGRFGVTGRSGGGAYSWWISALDERIKVAAPVAGITDLKNHVIRGGSDERYPHGTVEGHCDCMFQVNTYRWDYAQVAALVAPRPLLILNTDRDPIFPLDGVVRLYHQLQRIYKLHQAEDRLGLVITPGGHQDSQEIRLPAFNWFNRHLMGEEPPIETFAYKFFEPKQLKVFAELPTDQGNTGIQNTFTQIKSSTDGGDQLQSLTGQQVLADLKIKTFGGWPETPVDLQIEKVFDLEHDGVRLAGYDFDSQSSIRLRLYVSHRIGLTQADSVHLEVLNNPDWYHYLQLGSSVLADVWTEELKVAGISTDEPASAETKQALADQLSQVKQQNEIFVTFMPRGHGLTSLTDEERYLTQMRRRLMLLGQTLAGMQVWDVRRCLQVIRTLPGCQKISAQLWGVGEMASIVTLASLYESNIGQLHLKQYPTDDKSQPDFLNISRIVTPNQILTLAREKATIHHLD